jgi:hypothetical protein
MRKVTGFLPALALGVAGAVSGVTSASAGPMSYTETATVTGCLGVATVTACLASPTFTNATVTLAMTSAATISNPSTNFFDIPGSATVTVLESGGPVTATFTHPIQVFSNFSMTPQVPIPTVGFRDTGFSSPVDILDSISSLFNGYALNTTIGPITGTTLLGAGSPPPGSFPGFATSGGAFIPTSVGANATFTAAVAVPAPPIGRGLSVLVAVCGVLAGARFLVRERHV